MSRLWPATQVDTQSSALNASLSLHPLLRFDDDRIRLVAFVAPGDYAVQATARQRELVIEQDTVIEETPIQLVVKVDIVVKGD